MTKLRSAQVKSFCDNSSSATHRLTSQHQHSPSKSSRPLPPHSACRALGKPAYSALSSTSTSASQHCSLRCSLRGPPGPPGPPFRIHNTRLQSSNAARTHTAFTSHLRSSHPRRPSRRASASHYSRRHPLPVAETLESTHASWTIPAVVLVGALFYSVWPGDTEPFDEQKQKSSSPPTPLLSDDDDDDDVVEERGANQMTGEALPGRPGTLTPEQEEKLAELWIATLQVFGVIEKENGATDATRPRSDTASSTKKPMKKKRMSMFRSSKSKDDEDQLPPPSTIDADDKYGQHAEFKNALASQTPESLRATFWSMVKHDHPDALLLRFLRARKWDVEKALVMMISTMKWRSHDMHVDDDIMKNGELGSLTEEKDAKDPTTKRLHADTLNQMRMGKSFLHGTDATGRPMCFVRVRLHHGGEQCPESLERYTVFVIETARLTLNPPVDTACVVFDMTGFSMANMDYTPLKFMIKCFEANYPESLGVVLVHKAPWVFQGIWKIIKGWLDPVVASKVQFTNNNAEMGEYVPSSQILKELGGVEDWSYQYVEPVPGENDLMKDTETRDKLLAEREGLVENYEKWTLDWLYKKGDQAEVRTQRQELATQLKQDYWRLDPYIRAKTFYDRIGMINPGGKIDFYPSKAAPMINEKENISPAQAVVNGNGVAQPVTTSTEDVD